MKSDAQYGSASLPDAADEARSLRRRFAGGHAFALMVLFGPPVVLCIALGVSLDIVYFVGRGWLYILLLLPLTLVFPVLTISRHRPTGLVLASVLIPCAVFIIVGQHYATQSEVAVSALRSRDCFLLDKKRELQRAYEVALKIYRACPAAQSREETVAGCAGYETAAQEFHRQFTYLEGLEIRFPCAGICHRGPRLWGKNHGVEMPSCGLFVAEWMKSAHIEAEMVLAYSVVVAIAAIPAVMLVLQPFLQSWYLRKAWPRAEA